VCQTAGCAKRLCAKRQGEPKGCVPIGWAAPTSLFSDDYCTLMHERD